MPGERTVPPVSGANALADDLERFRQGQPVQAKPIGAARRAGRWLARHPLSSLLTTITAFAVLGAIGAGVRNWQREEHYRLELKAAQEAEERQRFYAGLERVRQRRGDPYTPWSRQSLADLRELAALPSSREYLAELRSETAAGLAAVDLVPGPLLADFPAYAAHFSADDRWLAVAGKEAYDRGRVELTDRRTMTRRDLVFPVDAKWRAQEKRPDGARSIRFSPDSRWLVVGTRSGWLVRWDMWNQEVEPLAWPARLEGPPEPGDLDVRTLGFTGDGTLLSGTHGAVRGWTIADGRATPLALKKHRIPLDFYPIAEEMAIRKPDGYYDLLRVGPGTFVPDRQFEGTPHSCLAPNALLMAYHPDSATGLSVRYAHPFARPRPFQTWVDRAMPTHMAFSPSGDLLAVVYEHDLRLRVWDVPAGVLLAERVTDQDSTHVTFSPDGRQLVVSGLHGARAYAIPVRAIETIVIAEPEAKSVAAPADHSSVVVVAMTHGQAPRLYRALLTPVPPPGMPSAEILSLHRVYHQGAVSLDGRQCVVSGAVIESGAFGDDLIQDQTGARLKTPLVSDVQFGPDGWLWVIEQHHLRLGSMDDGLPTVWRNDPERESAGATLKCIAPGRRLALLGRRDGRVFRLDPTGKEVDSWAVMKSAVLSLALSADEGTAVAGGERGEVRLINLSTGAVTEVPNAHRAAVYSVAHGPTFFATGSADRRVRLWTPAGELIATPEMGGPVRKILVGTRGDTLLVQVEGE